MSPFDPVHHIVCPRAHMQTKTAIADNSGIPLHERPITSLLVRHADLPTNRISREHLLPFATEREMSPVYLIGESLDGWLYVLPYEYGNTGNKEQRQQRLKIISIEHEGGLLDHLLDGPYSPIPGAEQLHAASNQYHRSYTYDSRGPSPIQGIDPSNWETLPAMNSMIENAKANGTANTLLFTDLLIFHKAAIACEYA